MQRTIAELESELAILYSVTQTVHSLELAQVLQKIVKIASSVTAADSCLIYVLDKDKEQLILKASKNPHKKLLEKITLRVGEGITGWVAQHKKPVVIESRADQDPRFKFFQKLPEDRYEAFLSVPILNKSKVIGVINIQHKQKHTYSNNEIHLLTAIGKLVGGAVVNALLIEETMHLKEALVLRKLVERAKGIIMKKTGLSEQEAYALMQKQSMKSGKSLKEVSDAVVLSDTFKLG
ncbi:ANTAR domain-containing protein [Candidatus Microgenomates bacterium]|nr:MAG: ANTAR domain-containing protein [Candidatus Microgenomates bacterium]